MAHRHKAHRAKGGTMKGRMEYTKDSNVQREAGSTKDKFKHGGLKAFGGKSKGRADRKARGGAAGFARGGATHSPFSSAAKGNDKKRFPSDRDHHQPRAAGGQVFKRGGSVRPSPSAKHEYNFGNHGGSGHEEGTQRSHKPVHHKHGGAEGPVGHGSKHHAGHGGHMAHHPHHDGAHPSHGHGGHKAKGRKHRKDGGKVDEEEDRAHAKKGGRDDKDDVGDEEDEEDIGCRPRRAGGGSLWDKLNPFKKAEEPDDDPGLNSNELANKFRRAYREGMAERKKPKKGDQ